MVINIGFLKDGRYEEVEEEIKACEIVTNAGAEFIKISTGFSTAGATFDDIALMKEHVGENVKIKAAVEFQVLMMQKNSSVLERAV